MWRFEVNTSIGFGDIPKEQTFLSKWMKHFIVALYRVATPMVRYQGKLTWFPTSRYQVTCDVKVWSPYLNWFWKYPQKANRFLSEWMRFIRIPHILPTQLGPTLNIDSILVLSLIKYTFTVLSLGFTPVLLYTTNLYVNLVDLFYCTQLVNGCMLGSASSAVQWRVYFF